MCNRLFVIGPVGCSKTVIKAVLIFSCLLAYGCDDGVDNPVGPDSLAESPPPSPPPPPQSPPDPVVLPIRNILQETEVWCWAAVAQQIILSLRGLVNTPPQCALVSIANKAPPDYCCGGFWPDCIRPGSIAEIQALLLQFGGRYSSYALPADAVTVYNTLRSGRAIIMLVRSTPFGSVGHFVVIRGMRWFSTPSGWQAELLINDPLRYFSEPIPFNNIAPFWQSAIVVH